MQVVDKDTYLCVGNVADLGGIGKVFLAVRIYIKMFKLRQMWLAYNKEGFEKNSEWYLVCQYLFLTD